MLGFTPSLSSHSKLIIMKIFIYFHNIDNLTNFQALRLKVYHLITDPCFQGGGPCSLMNHSYLCFINYTNFIN